MSLWRLRPIALRRIDPATSLRAAHNALRCVRSRCSACEVRIS
jgi:hypothetical protein